MKSRNFIYTILNIVLMAGLFLWLQSCNKRDPNPELKDAIFKDLNDELALAKAELEKQQAEKASLQQELKNAPPQTGLAKTFQFKIENAADAETFYAQKKRFFEIRVEERKIYVQKRYLESLLPNGRKWPDPEEEEQYKLKLKFMRAKLDWEAKSKPQKKDVPRGTSTGAASGGHGGGEPAKPAGGGH